MAGTATTRVRAVATFALTALLLLGEFGFVMGVYHLDDDVAARQRAETRLSGTLTAWRPACVRPMPRRPTASPPRDGRSTAARRW
jgi:hypothetical protein